MSLYRTWAAKWGVPMAAVLDLEQQVGLVGTRGVEANGKSEAYSTSVMLLDASKHDVLVYRNNVGAFKDERGNFVRYGLANESEKQNKVLKSSDWIGVRKRLILPQDVGSVIGQLTAREMKEPGWTYAGTEREVGQLNFISLMISYGADAKFCTGAGSFE